MQKSCPDSSMQKMNMNRKVVMIAKSSPVVAPEKWRCSLDAHGACGPGVTALQLELIQQLEVVHDLYPAAEQVTLYR